MRGVDGQGRLPDPGHPADADHPYGGTGLGGTRQHRGDPLAHLPAPDEVGDVGGKLRGLDRASPRGGPGHGLGPGVEVALLQSRLFQAGVGRQQALLQAAQGGGGLQAELPDEHLAQVLVHLQRLATPPHLVEGGHELGVEVLVEGVGGDELLELADELAVAAQPQVGRKAQLQGAQAALLQPGDLRRQQFPRRQVDQGGPPPQGQGLGEGLGGALGVLALQRAPAVGDQPFEAEHVDGLRRGRQQVPVRLGDDRGGAGGAEHLAQLVDVGVQGGQRGGGRALAPQLVDQLAGGHDLVVAQDEHRQDRPHFGGARCQVGGVVDDLQRTQNPEFHVISADDRQRRPSRPALGVGVTSTPGGLLEFR